MEVLLFFILSHLWVAVGEFPQEIPIVAVQVVVVADQMVLVAQEHQDKVMLVGEVLLTEQVLHQMVAVAAQVA